MTADYKTREPIGTFIDECGFTYSRKAKDDINKIGTIKEFGQVWIARLKELICKRNSIRKIAREMKCDPKTVVKYAEILGLRNMINSKIKCVYNQRNNNGSKIYKDKYRSDIANLIKENSNITRQNIRKLLYKQYMWLYRNDREWFEKNLPKPKRIIYIRDTKSLWLKRDSEILTLLKHEYKKLINDKKLRRITISLLGRRINKSALLEKKIDKLPRTKKYLNRIKESIEDYECRRVDVVCKHLNDEGETLKEWEIMRLCGLKSNISERVKERIKYNLSLYNSADSHNFI